MLAMTGDGTPIEEQVEEVLEETLDALRQDADASRALLGLAAALGEVRSVDETLDLVVRMVPEMLGGDRCFATTWDRSGDRFIVHARSGFDPELSAVLDELALQENGLPILRQALLAGKAPVLIENVSDGAVEEEQAERRKLGAYIGIPLIRRGEELGALGIEFKSPRTFSGKELTLAHSIARQVSVAVANARQVHAAAGTTVIRTAGWPSDEARSCHRRGHRSGAETAGRRCSGSLPGRSHEENAPSCVP